MISMALIGLVVRYYFWWKCQYYIPDFHIFQCLHINIDLNRSVITMAPTFVGPSSWRHFFRPSLIVSN